MFGWRALAATAIVVIAGLATACDTGDGRTMRPPTLGQRLPLITTATTLVAAPSIPTSSPPDRGAPNGFTLEVPWATGTVIDRRYTCEGDDVAPGLTWTTPPAGTAELALIVSDPSADDTVHWVVAGIKPAAGQQPEAAPFDSGVEGVNDFGEVGWTGPCPTPGDPPHSYRFQLIALPEPADLSEPFSVEDLLDVPQRNPIVVTESTGTYP